MSTTNKDLRISWIAAAMVLGLGGCARDVPSAVPPSVVAATASAPAQSTDGLASMESAEPPVSSMRLAQAPHKLGAPVDLFYQIEGEADAGRPLMLHLAAVPRVPGSNLVVSLKKETGISTTATAQTTQKASASTTYRQQISLTKLAGGPAELHVLVAMDMPEGSAHSWFSIPLDAVPAAAKQSSRKLE